MAYALPLALVPTLLGAALAAPATPCPPPGTTRATLLELKQANFEVAAPAERDRLATALVACLGDPDPQIRDGVVFEGLSHWLRARQLSAETVRALKTSLSAALAGPKDTQGFRHPFALLALSEVARVDRLEALFTETERAALVALAAESMRRIDDYRGFDPRAGWRHGVAHGSDLILQLGLNARVGADGLRQLMDALRAQIAPTGTHAYTFGEPERLARATVFTYRRGVLEPAYWQGFFGSLADPKPLASWGAAFLSLEGLARRHNTIAFLQAVAFAGRSAGDEVGTTLAAEADNALALVAG